MNAPAYSPVTGQAGLNRDGSLTVSGGTAAVTYAVTGTVSSQSGYLHLPEIEVQRFQETHGFAVPGWMKTPDEYSTYGEHSSLTVQLSHGGGTLTLSNALLNTTQQQSSLQGDLAALEFEYVDTAQVTTSPLFPNYYELNTNATSTITNALSLQHWAPWRALPIDATIGMNTQNHAGSILLPRDYVLCGVNPSDASCGTDSLGSYTVSTGTNTSASLTAGTTLRQRLATTPIGFVVNTLSQSSFSAQTTGLPVGVTVPSSFQYPVGGGPTYTTVNSATYNWYVQPTLNFSNHFFASPGFALSGGSNSGTSGGVTGGGVTGLSGSGSGGGGGSVLGGLSALSLFPKLDFSWIAVQRSPDHPLFGLTLLRPRIAFGIAGVQPGPAETLRILTPLESYVGGLSTPTDVLQVSTLGNTKLVPEKDEELEGGLDAQFWNQRLTVTVTGYQKLAYNAILSIPVAPSVLPLQTTNVINKNVGTIRNTGLEATVTQIFVDTRRLEWSATELVTANRNLLVSLNKGQPPIIAQGVGYQTRLTPGYPVFGLWAQPILGYDDRNHDGFIEEIGQGGTESSFGNEVLVGDSANYVGEEIPNYETSVSTTLSLFNGRISVNTGVDYQNGLTQVASSTGSSALNNPTLTPLQVAAFAADQAGVTSIGVMQTVNTLRWQSLAVTYNLSPHLAQVFHTNAMAVSLQGQNLGLRTNYRGKDPNVNAYGTGNLTVDDGNELPQPRTWNLRFTMGF